MLATLDAPALVKAITGVKNLTGAELINLVADSKGLHVSGSGTNGANISLTIEAEVRTNGKATVNHVLLTGGIKGRKKLEMATKGTKLTWKEAGGGRSYSGDVLTSPFADVHVRSPKSKPIKISSDAQKTLNSAIELVALNNLYTEDPMYVWVVGTKKALSVTCFDSFHMAHYHNTTTPVGEFAFQLSLETFKVLNTLSNGKSYKLELDDGTLIASNDWFQADMPLSQDESGMTVDVVKNYLTKLKTNGFFEIKTKDFKTILENSVTAYESASTPLVIESKKEKLNLSISGSYSTMRESLSAKHKLKGEIKVDPRLVLDVLEKIEGDDVRFESTPDSSMVVRQEVNGAVVIYGCSII